MGHRILFREECAAISAGENPSLPLASDACTVSRKDKRRMGSRMTVKEAGVMWREAREIKGSG